MPEGSSGACKLHCFWLQLHYSPVNEFTSQFIYSPRSHRVFYCLAKVYLCVGVRGGAGFKQKVSEGVMSLLLLFLRQIRGGVEYEEGDCLHAWIDQSPSLSLPVDALNEGFG